MWYILIIIFILIVISSYIDNIDIWITKKNNEMVERYKMKVTQKSRKVKYKWKNGRNYEVSSKVRR